MRQGIDLHIPFHVLAILRTRQRVGTINVHSARAADTLATRTAEGQGGIDLVLNFDQGIQDHRSAFIHVQFVGVHAGIFTTVGVIAVDLELTQVVGTRTCMMCSAALDFRIGGKVELDHIRILSKREPWARYMRLRPSRYRYGLDDNRS